MVTSYFCPILCIVAGTQLSQYKYKTKYLVHSEIYRLNCCLYRTYEIKMNANMVIASG
jgi:hypothetical protein